MTNNIAIVVVAFNRPDSLKRLLESLNKIIIDKNENLTLHISIDYQKDNRANLDTIDVANNFTWKFGKKIVDTKNENYGLKRHVLDCGNLTQKYKNIIVLEDDLLVSPLILSYAKQALNSYSKDDNIAGIGLYSFQRNPQNAYPFCPIDNGSNVYFLQYACSWGQLWTRAKWEKFYSWYQKNSNTDFSNDATIPKNVRMWGEKSWLKYHIIYCIKQDKYFVYPQKGLTTNFTEMGEHNKQKNNAYQINMYTSDKDIKFTFAALSEANNIYDAFFENINLKKYLPKDTIIDLYGEKEDYSGNKYLLSTVKMDKEITKSYSLQMYPIENNIINEINGDEIFLYDLTSIKKNRHKLNRFQIIKYFFKLDLISSKNKVLIIKNLTKQLGIKLIKK